MRPRAAVWLVVLALAGSPGPAGASVGTNAGLPAPGDPALAIQLRAIGDLAGARNEWQRALATAPGDDERLRAHLELARSPEAGDPASEFDYGAARGLLPGRRERDAIVLEEALARLGSGSFGVASQWFDELSATAADPAVRAEAAWFGGVCALRVGEWARADERFRACGLFAPADMARMDSLLGAPRLGHRSPTIARRLSLVLPGSGFVYAGDPWGAISGAGVNALTLGSVARALRAGSATQGAYLAAFYAMRYYAGSSLKAGLAAERHNRRAAERFGREVERTARAAIAVATAR